MSMQQQGEPEPEPAPSAQQQGVEALFDGFPCELVRDKLVGGNRAVVASRRMDADEQVLASAALGFAIDRRHMATRCAWCFATREANGGAAVSSDDDEEEDGIAWQLRCERCHSAYYCSQACLAAATPQHHLECAALCAIEQRKQLKKEERLLARLLTSILGTLAAADDVAPSPSPPRPTLQMLLELFPDQRESVGASKRRKQRLVAAKMVLEVAGHTLLAVLPEADVATLNSLLERGPMNEFGLWCADGEAGSAGTAYYPAAAMLNHSCLPNVTHQFEGTALVFYTLRPIEAGEPLCFAYAMPSQQPTAARQKVLSDSWCFACRCPRCTNSLPSEEIRSYDKRYICSCGQAKVPRKRLRRTGASGSTDIDHLVARWTASEGVAAEVLCCCNIWNMVVSDSQNSD